jgi:hypothetical protein
VKIKEVTAIPEEGKYLSKRGEARFASRKAKQSKEQSTKQETLVSKHVEL